MSGCAISQQRSIRADSIGIECQIVGRLGYALGTQVEIEGEFVREHSMRYSGDLSTTLLVRQVSGRKLAVPVYIGLVGDLDRQSQHRVGDYFHRRVIEWGDFRCLDFDIANVDAGRSMRRNETISDGVGVLVRRQGFRTYVEVIDVQEPNQALLPTPTAVTPPAAQEPRQP